MNVYKMVPRPAVRTMLGMHRLDSPKITQEELARVLAKATLRSVIQSPTGGVSVEMQVDRPTHDRALEEIAQAITVLGFNVAEIEVQEWASQTAEGLFVGLLSGGGAGSATRNGPVTVCAAVGGAAIGCLVGSKVERLVRKYTARSTRDGWVLSPLVTTPDSASAEPSLRWAV